MVMLAVVFISPYSLSETTSVSQAIAVKY